MKITGWYNSYGNKNQKARDLKVGKLLSTSIGGRTGEEPDVRLTFEGTDEEKTLMIIMSLKEAQEFTERINNHLKEYCQ